MSSNMSDSKKDKIAQNRNQRKQSYCFLMRCHSCSCRGKGMYDKDMGVQEKELGETVAKSKFISPKDNCCNSLRGSGDCSLAGNFIEP